MYSENIEEVVFAHNLKLEHRYIGPGMRNKIKEIVNVTNFVKENFCVLGIKDIKIISVKHTHAQSDCVASLEIRANCLVPEEGKIFKGVVTNIINGQLSVVTVESNIDVIIKGNTDRNKGDVVNVKVLSQRFVNGKIFCMGKYE